MSVYFQEVYLISFNLVSAWQLSLDNSLAYHIQYRISSVHSQFGMYDYIYYKLVRRYTNDMWKLFKIINWAQTDFNAQWLNHFKWNFVKSSLRN